MSLVPSIEEKIETNEGHEPSVFASAILRSSGERAARFMTVSPRHLLWADMPQVEKEKMEQDLCRGLVTA
eukprot:2712070-Amphidinium_carterae.1